MRTWVRTLVLAALVAAPLLAANQESLDRMKADVTYLASDECEGRGVETEGINKAADYIVEQFEAAGLKPGGVEGTWFQPFTVATGAPKLTGPNAVTLFGPLGQEIVLTEGKHYQVSGLSSSGEFPKAELVFVGFGIDAEEPPYNEYDGVDVEGKVVVVLRQTPRASSTEASFENAEDYAPLIYKVNTAAEHGAVGVIFVNDPGKAEDTDALMPFDYASGSSTGKIPVIHIRRSLLNDMLQGSQAVTLRDIEQRIDRTLEPNSLPLTGWSVAVETGITRVTVRAKNVIGVLEGAGPLKDEIIVIGGHYDHLGRGERGSLARGEDRNAIHYGADDNGSGTTAVIELARRLGSIENREGRSIVFMAFSGEERGLIGSRFYTNEPLFPLEDTVAMINLDMVGRLNNNSLEVLGTGTGDRFHDEIMKLNEQYEFEIKESTGIWLNGGGSDHQSFYTKDIPVLFFFTGIHPNYHRPSDTADRINIEGLGRIVDLVEELTVGLSTGARPEYRQVTRGSGTPSAGPVNVPKISFAPGSYDDTSEDGLPVGAVTKDGPADKGGLKEGDLIIGINDKAVKNIDSYMAAMAFEKAGNKVKFIVLRDGEKVELTIVPE